MAGEDLRARARGSVLGVMCGDALGMSLEGSAREDVRAEAQARWGQDLVKDFIRGVPMGTFVPAGEPGQYKEAREVRDQNFVPSGPVYGAGREAVERQCTRFAMYTDDTCATLAVGASIARVGKVDPANVARTVAEFFRDNEAFRGCPPTAKMVLQAMLEGVDVEKTGLQPYFPFPGGSFANGGAMRINLLPIAYRNASATALREAVTQAVLATHRHPEAVDFAVIQAAAVQYALKCAGAAAFNTTELLDDLAQRCETEAMQRVVAATSAALQNTKADTDEVLVLDGICRQEPRPGSGFGFQIASVHMAPCVLWCACRYVMQPARAVQAAIDIGGDTDTTACMVGAIVGALHGEQWCQHWASQLENGPHGRDYALNLAEQLAALDLP